MATVEQLNVKISADLTDFEKKMGSVSKTLKDTGQKMSDVGTKMTKGITLPIVAGFAGIAKATTDLEATEAKYETVFAGMTDVTDEFIDKFQELTPATQAETQSMVSSIQDLLVPMGFVREEATELTGEFLHVAGALANFNSGTHTSQDVVGALQSALVGSFEPLRSLGVQLDKNTIKEKAMEMGLIDSVDEMNNQIEAQVILAEVYNQSGDALDAYTEDNLDAKTKIGLLKSEIVDVAAQIGNVLLPIISDITEKIRGWVEKFSELDEGTQNTILVVAGIVAALGPLLMIIGKLTVAMSFLAANPIALIIVGIVALIAIVVLLVKNWETIAQFFSDLWLKIKIIFHTFVNNIKDFLAETWEGIKEKTLSIWNSIKEFFINTWNNIKDTVFGIWDALKTKVSDIWNGIKDLISGTVDNIKTKVVGVFENIKETVLGIWEGLKTGIKGIINGIIGGVEGMANGVVKGINKVVNAINKIQVTIPDWVPGVGGKTIGFNLRTLSEISIPRLADGAVIPPNREFLATLGDQRSGVNIETPLSTMVDAFEQSLTGNASNAGNTINIYPQTIAESTIISLFNRFDARLGVDG